MQNINILCSRPALCDRCRRFDPQVIAEDHDDLKGTVLEESLDLRDKKTRRRV